MTVEMRYLRRKDALAIGNAAFPRVEHYYPPRFVAAIQDVGDANLASVRRSLAIASGGRRNLGAADPDEFPNIELIVTPAPGHDVHSWPSISFQLVGSGKLRIEVLVAVTDSSGDMEDVHDTFESLARGFCAGRDVSVANAFSYEDDDFYIHNIYLALDHRGATIADGYREAASLYELCQKFQSADYVAKELVRTVLAAGRPDLLKGQYESRDLECKSQAYDLSSLADKIELAQDVARFANSEFGGFLVIGLKTKNDGQGDRIVGVRPLSSAPKANRYHKVIDHMVFPPVEGLTVQALPASPGGPPALVLIDVPAQPEELKPFMVAGAIVQGRIEGAFISIVRRRGEHSVPVSPAAIHAALAAGQASLRGSTPAPAEASPNSGSPENVPPPAR